MFASLEHHQKFLLRELEICSEGEIVLRQSFQQKVLLASKF